MLDPMRREIAAYDALLGADAGALAPDWADVHAAVPRFARSAIEIRVIDVQECPTADLAIAAATAALVRRLYDAAETRAARPPLSTARLVPIFDACIRDAEVAPIDDAAYLEALGVGNAPCTAGQLWQRLIDTLLRDGLLAPHWLPPLELIARRGTLARRIVRTLDGDSARLRPVYRELSRCLQDNRQFDWE